MKKITHTTGVVEDGIIAGNYSNKYDSGNFVVSAIMRGFEQALLELINMSGPSTIYEFGCGEGHWVMRLKKMGYEVAGSDFSHTVVQTAQRNAKIENIPPEIFHQRNIYSDEALPIIPDLILCCEVLEHLEDPRKGLEVLQKLVTDRIIISVPKEPIWRVLNMLRGKYLRDFGNTPGHIQHWSKKTFIELIAEYFEVESIRTPFPWTMALCKLKK